MRLRLFPYISIKMLINPIKDTVCPCVFHRLVLWPYRLDTPDTQSLTQWETLVYSKDNGEK